jgi:Flp pilus assembly protein TadG
MDMISAAFGHRLHTGLARARLGGERGQSIIEFAITLPVLLILVFGVWNFYSYYSRVTDYQNAARTLAEWVGRTDCYSPGMGSTIADTLGSNVYVYVAFEDNSGNVVAGASAGEMPKDSAPSDDGKTPEAEMCPAIPPASAASATQVRVVMWSNKLNIIRFKSPFNDTYTAFPAWSSGTAVSAIISQTRTTP